ncbi:MAG: alpha/beta hydrolase [Pseudomonadota bacterium]
MKFEIDGNEVYASTGGRDHVEGQAFIFFLHGGGNSHLTWSQQSRSFAYANYNVLSVDFPGHNLSGGEPIESVQDQAEWILKVMDHVGAEKATFVGHSQGGLVSLSLANMAPERVEKIVFVASAAAIPVNEVLISTAETKEERAKSSMTSWGLGPDAHHFDNSVPGFSHAGVGQRIMDLNVVGALATDLKACDGFADGLELAANVKCPTMCVLAAKDRMTPLKAGMKLAETLPNNTLHILPNSGHTIPTERPHEFNAHLREFLAQ